MLNYHSVAVRSVKLVSRTQIYAYICRSSGGVEEDRTPDLRIANATLSQLSYHPGEARILP
jgi:hypothetical protein